MTATQCPQQTHPHGAWGYAYYQSRWKVELFIDDLKTTLGMAVLTTLSPAMIRRELFVHIIAYNLLRALMTHGKSAESKRGPKRHCIGVAATGA